MQAAVVGAGDGELQRRQDDFVAAYGQAAEFLDDQPAYGVGFLAAVVRAEEGVDVFDFGYGVDAPAFGGNGEDVVGGIVFVEFVFDVADDFFDDVFKGNEAGCTAVFVDDDGHVQPLLAEGGEQGVEGFAFGDEKRGAQELFEVELFGVEGVFEQVFGVQDAEDGVFVAVDDGKARVCGFDDVGDDAFEAVGRFDDAHLRAGNHGVAHFEFGKVEYLLQPLQGVGVEYLLFVRLAQEGQYAFGGIGCVAVDAADESFEKVGFRRAVIHYCSSCEYGSGYAN